MTSIALRPARIARPLLLVIWMGSFVVSLSAVAYAAANGWIGGDNPRLLARELNTLYSPFLSVMTLFYFKNRKRSAAPADSTAFYLALTVSVLWNALVVGLVVRLVVGGFAEDVIATLHDVPGLFVWLVGGGIGFYFGSACTPKAE